MAMAMVTVVVIRVVGQGAIDLGHQGSNQRGRGHDRFKSMKRRQD
jgi:hypothetical protein